MFYPNSTAKVPPASLSLGSPLHLLQLNASQKTLYSTSSGASSSLWRGIIPPVSHLSQRGDEVEEQVSMFGMKRFPIKGVGGGSSRDLDALRQFT